ncbi:MULTISPECIES: replicative DNA helicase [Kitasatospora]|uniref:replicative DNA helicase n=1 Tax=Kitasatospora TaxID=2063 RepID=UPI000CAD41E1|nr:replicative DNA helicase [Kitasatospora sp. GP30]MDH6145961.1 replicative DNA helicase [Kitasatospora sp. GP30]
MTIADTGTAAEYGPEPEDDHLPLPVARQALEREQPHDLDAEQAVLGAMMLSTAAISDIVATLNGPGDFYRPAHQVIYRAILDLHDRSGGETTPDPILVTGELAARGELQQAGGPTYLHTCVNTVPTAVNAEHYAEAVRDLAAFRKVVETGTRLTSQGYAAVGEAREVVHAAMAQLQALVAGTAEAAPKLSVADRWQEFIDDQEHGIDPRALDTPWPDINEVVQLLPGHLVTVGAATAGGKSLFGMNLAAHVALHRNRPVLVASMEMGGKELMARLTAAESGVYLERLVKHKLDDNDWEKIARVSDVMRGAHNFYLDDSATQTLSRLRARLRCMASRGHQPAMLVCDYLQLVTPENTRANANRAQEVGEISRGLKRLAGEFGIPVVALAQFNRGAAGRRPLVSDFKESSAIEQDSNVIILLYRELAEDGNDIGPAAGTVEAIISKNRSGPSGRVVPLAFQGHMARLSSMARL